MEEWLRIGMPQVHERLKHDAEFQKMLQDLNRAEEEYLKVMKKLTSEERACVDDYIALCEEVEYQKTYTAYRCGKMRRKVDE